MPRVLAVPKVPISRVLDPCRHLDEITAMQQIVEQTTPIREEEAHSRPRVAHVSRKAVWPYVGVFGEVLGLGRSLSGYLLACMREARRVTLPPRRNLFDSAPLLDIRDSGRASQRPVFAAEPVGRVAHA
jgi:hypothetical protein